MIPADHERAQALPTGPVAGRNLGVSGMPVTWRCACGANGVSDLTRYGDNAEWLHDVLRGR
jgi:hypothetical protein